VGAVVGENQALFGFLKKKRRRLPSGLTSPCLFSGFIMKQGDGGLRALKKNKLVNVSFTIQNGLDVLFTLFAQRSVLSFPFGLQF
jgi:hypothetical protein